MLAMVLLTTVPGLTYLAETAFHGGFDGLTFALVGCLVVAATWTALGTARPTGKPHDPALGSGGLGEKTGDSSVRA
jgi:hypothetical protein